MTTRETVPRQNGRSEHAATLLKPACRSCYGKYKDALEFVA